MSKPLPRKVIVTHPQTGTQRRMDADIYEAVKAAILESLKNSKGKPFAELTNDVTAIIKKKIPAFSKSIPWYCISIRLDLETKGIVETYTEKGKKLNRLKK